MTVVSRYTSPTRLRKPGAEAPRADPEILQGALSAMAPSTVATADSPGYAWIAFDHTPDQRLVIAGLDADIAAVSARIDKGSALAVRHGPPIPPTWLAGLQALHADRLRLRWAREDAWMTDGSGVTDGYGIARAFQAEMRALGPVLMEVSHGTRITGFLCGGTGDIARDRSVCLAMLAEAVAGKWEG